MNFDKMGELKYLIDNHFHRLKNDNIKLSFHKDKGSFAYITKTLFRGYKISLSKKDCEKMSLNQVRGVLSHELAHIYNEKRQGVIITFFKNILYLISDKQKTKEERKVDSIVIERGCGKYLLEFMIYHDKHYRKYNKTDGLTTKEIRKELFNSK